MNVVVGLYLAALFVAFVPGVLLTLPSGGSKYTVLAVHAVLFTVVLYFTYGIVYDVADGNAPGAAEGFYKRRSYLFR